MGFTVCVCVCVCVPPRETVNVFVVQSRAGLPEFSYVSKAHQDES